MSENDLPAWFKVYADSIERRIGVLEETMGRALRELGVKAEDIYREARRTNGRMTRAEDRLAHLEKEDEKNFLSYHRQRERGTKVAAAFVGAGGGVALLLVAEALKAAH